MAAFYSLLCKAIKKQPAGRSGRLFWRSGRDSNPRAIARKLISSYLRASSDEIIKVTLRYLEIPQTRMNQGFSGENHEFTTLRLDPRI